MIKTERLSLEIFHDGDEERVIQILSNDKIKENYISYDLDYEGLKKKFKQLKLDSKIKIHYARGIFLERLLIGIINDVRTEDHRIEIEIAILPEYQGKGYGTEALTAAVDELFNKKGFDEIASYCFKDNVGYAKTLTKIGFTKLDKEIDMTYRGRDVVCTFYSIKK